MYLFGTKLTFLRVLKDHLMGTLQRLCFYASGKAMTAVMHVM